MAARESRGTYVCGCSSFPRAVLVLLVSGAVADAADSLSSDFDTLIQEKRKEGSSLIQFQREGGTADANADTANLNDSSTGACERMLAVPASFSEAEAAAVRSTYERSMQLADAYSQPQSKKWNPSSVQDLHQQYQKIFRTGNRNAASHRWSTFVLDRAFHMTSSQFQNTFSGFCAVSGSPVRPSDYNRYGLTLPLVPSAKGKWAEGAHMFGYLHYCCWPCVCDTQDFIKIDTRTIVTADSGPEGRQYHFAVLGNPCSRERLFDEQYRDPFGRGFETIRRVASEVRCSEDHQLEGATLSDNGYIIIAMFFDPEPVDGATLSALSTSSLSSTPGQVMKNPRTGVAYQSEREFADMCEQRKRNGYNSGMGEIFRRVAGISPILTHTVKSGQCDDQPRLSNASHNPMK